MPKKGRKTSNRTTLKDKYKIQKRVTEKHRKDRKLSKKDVKANGKSKTKSNKDPGIPNSWPFKDQLLREVEFQKNKMEEIATLKEDARRMAQVNKAREPKRTLDDLVADAATKNSNYSNSTDGQNTSVTISEGISSRQTSESATGIGQSSRRAYLRELNKVIDNADVILQVLDARFPHSSRATAIEDAILSKADKKLVLVLNKVDLVPASAVQGWLKFLRRSHPTVAVKASTQDGARVGQSKSKIDNESGLKSTSAVGMEGLLQLLKNYSRNMDRKTSVTVGIIGYPNVGKSSIINSLKRTRAVGVSSTPGFTTSMQEVKLDKNIKLLDSPGVVFADGEETLLRNCVDTDSIADPMPAIRELISKCNNEQLMSTYAIPHFESGNELQFLSMVAKVKGKMLKGGIPDKVGAGKAVLRDWNSGKIPFFVPPPTINDSLIDNSAVVLKSFGDDFKVEEMDAAILDGNENDAIDFVAMEDDWNNSDNSGIGADEEMRG